MDQIARILLDILDIAEPVGGTDVLTHQGHHIVTSDSPFRKDWSSLDGLDHGKAGYGEKGGMGFHFMDKI